MSKVFWMTVHGVVAEYPCRKVKVTVAALTKDDNRNQWWATLSGQEVPALEVALPEPEGLVYLHDPDGKLMTQLSKPYNTTGVRALRAARVDPPVGTPTSKPVGAVAPAPVKGVAPEPPVGKGKSSPAVGTPPQED